MTDDRDGQVYKTVKIGNQVWMAQNLNYFTSDMSYRASCHGGKTQHCDVAGRLYTWAVAMDSVKKAKDGVYACGDGKICTSTENYQGICPDGWHLPTKAEWDSLLSFVGGMPAASKILKSRVGWNNDGNGLDVVGFSALPAGDEFDGTGAYRNEGLGTSFWSVTEYYSVGAQVLRLSYNDEASTASYDLKERSLSIRCINDDGIIEYPSNSSAKSSSSSVIPASSGNLPSSSSTSVTLATPCKTETEDNCESPPIPLAGVTTMMPPIAKSMVAYILGLRLWIALQHGVIMVKTAAITFLIHRLIQFRAFVRVAGTCRVRTNGVPC